MLYSCTRMTIVGVKGLIPTNCPIGHLAMHWWCHVTWYGKECIIGPLCWPQSG